MVNTGIVPGLRAPERPGKPSLVAWWLSELHYFDGGLVDLVNKKNYRVGHGNDQFADGK